MRIKSFKEFFSYGIIGIVNTGIHFLVFFFATKFFSQALSNSLAFTVAVVFSFFCNSIFTFKKTDKGKFCKNVLFNVNGECRFWLHRGRP